MSLYNYVFHYNPFDDIWYAVPRELYTEYWNNKETHGILKAKDIMVLVELIRKGEDFVKKLNDANV
jgi:hypothetical protein